MIINFKIFENKKKIKEGDVVKCIDHSDTEELLEYGKLYKIKNIYTYRSGDTQYIFYNINYEWNDDRFILATPEEIKKYELEQLTNKFNI